jgi:hypothetical protein
MNIRLIPPLVASEDFPFWPSCFLLFLFLFLFFLIARHSLALILHVMVYVWMTFTGSPLSGVCF